MLDPIVALAGLLVGFVVGLTGMGGGALMTPILVLLFKVEPLMAVSSDIVAAVIMKPVGGAVHWRHGTVHRQLVLWLMMGSIPAAFLGVILLRHFGSEKSIQAVVKTALGVALLVVAAGLVVRPFLQRKRRPELEVPLEVARIRTLLIGLLGGLVVGITSVGSGSLIIIMLLMLYPRMRLSELVGTDLVQAIPLVASAALAHLMFGEFHFALTASILIGSIPGVFIGARFSARAPDYVIRPALVVVLTASALKLLRVDTMLVGAVAALMTLLMLTLSVTAAHRAGRIAAAAKAEVSGPILSNGQG
ncbi:MAG TPA: sulfite exporter TauE/SafE family protein [Polyangia bacterium]|jgi:hypothetical protein|nr:sulfite exporter TauE/SafE family protein [Polyangia bacterium]